MSMKHKDMGASTVENAASTHTTTVSVHDVAVTDDRMELTEFSTAGLCISTSRDINVDGIVLNEEFQLTVGMSDSVVKQQIEDVLIANPVTGCFTIPITVVSDDVSEGNEATDTNDLEITVISIDIAPGVLSIDTSEVLQRAARLKDHGSKLFKTGNIEWAFKAYKRAMRYLIIAQRTVASDLPEKVDEYKTLLVQCYLNIAACQMSRKSWGHVIENCSKALSVDADHVKALYRRAKAYEGLQQYDLALKDLERAAVLEPSNSAVQKYMRNMRAKVKDNDAVLAKAMSKLFT